VIQWPGDNAGVIDGGALACVFNCQGLNCARSSENISLIQYVDRQAVESVPKLSRLGIDWTGKEAAELRLPTAGA
jgi:hypothetical protein